MLLKVGIVLILIGFLFMVFPPHKNTWFLGYRTPLSLKNDDTWNVAQEISSKSFTTLGIILAIIGDLPINISISFQVTVLILGTIIMLTSNEIYLRRIFNKAGFRKNIHSSRVNANEHY